MFHLELLVLLLDNVLELIRTSPYRVCFQIHEKRPAKGEAAKSHDWKHPDMQSLVSDGQRWCGKFGGMECNPP